MVITPADIIILFTAFLTLLLGCWVSFSAYNTRQRFLKVNLKTQLRVVGVPTAAGERMAEVRVVVTNTHRRRIEIGKMDFSARMADKNSASQITSNDNKMLFPTSLARRRPMISEGWEYSYVEPQQVLVYKGMMIIPADAAFVYVTILLEGSDDDVTFVTSPVTFALK